jgi:hypothetical protein
MYQIKCDDYILYDPRADDLVLLNPKCKLEVNTVGEGSFTILSNHPFYDKLKKLKSVFEIRQDNHVIFRGRMTEDSRDFNNKLDVDLEGILAFTNDSVVEPFSFPGGFPDATAAANVVEYFLQWIIERHNAQVEEWKRFKLGVVTVADPNNYLSRSSSEFNTTWETLKSKLFDSALGGYLIVRYEDDGNYIDYVSEFELTNVQPVTFGKNLLDITSKSDATSTYSAILPLGAEMETDDSEKDAAEDTKTRLTLEELEDGDLTDDLVKEGKFIYSKSARSEYGWICVPPKESTWNDVTTVEALKRKAMECLTGTGTLLSSTITIKAVDLSFTDEQIQSFRINRNILVNSPIHGLSNASYQLTKLSIDILNPQNTAITIGEAKRSLVDINRQHESNQNYHSEIIYGELAQNKNEIDELKNQLTIQRTQIISDCNAIILSALEAYLETSNFEEYKETVSTQLQIMADEILMNFTTTTEKINNVDGDLQNKFTEVYKYISFADGGITLGSSENAITLIIENDMIVFKKNGLQFGWWDGVDFHTGNIVVEVNERAQFGNFAFVPRSDGSLMFLKVGD